MFAVSVFLGILAVAFVIIIVWVVKKIEKRLRVTPVTTAGSGSGVAPTAPSVEDGEKHQQTGTPPNAVPSAPFKTLNNSNGHMTIAYGNFPNNNNNNTNMTNNTMYGGVGGVGGGVGGGGPFYGSA